MIFMMIAADTIHIKYENHQSIKSVIAAGRHARRSADGALFVSIT